MCNSTNHSSWRKNSNFLRLRLRKIAGEWRQGGGCAGVPGWRNHLSLGSRG